MRFHCDSPIRRGPPLVSLAGMVLVFVDAVFFGVLRYAYRSLWASVVAHGLSNTVGMVAFFVFGPFSALW